MATTSVTDLIARAQAASDQHDNFVTRTQWLYWINYFNKELAVMVAQLGYPYHQYDESIALTGALEYTVVEEPLAILGFYFVEDDGRLRKLKIMNPVEKRRLGNQMSGDPERVVVMRNTNNDLTIQFQPVPTSGTVTMLAIEMPAELTISDSVKYPLGWEEYIVLKAARRALAKEETINPLIMSDIQEVVEHIKMSAANYIMASCPTIRNIKEENENLFDGPDSWFWL